MNNVQGLESAFSGTTANGVPFVALPPEDGQDARALILLWHGADPPRTEEALAAAMPMRDLAAWRVYLGLPLSGRRLPSGGVDEIMQRAAEDPVARLFHPMINGAVNELLDAIDGIRRQLEVDDSLPLGIFGFSAGGAAALAAVARQELPLKAAVTFGAVIELRDLVDYTASLYGMAYEWTETRERLAEEVSVMYHADSLATSGARILLGVGTEDPYPIVDSTRSLETLVREAGGSVEMRQIDGLAHGFVDEPGHVPAPQTTDARKVERFALDWFGRHFG